MRTLPPQTTLPDVPLTPRHHPDPGGYAGYRQCLRWDSGFTCSFCFLHEADLVEHGIEGTGLFWVEHRVTQTADPSRRDEYANCLYSCRFCNRARGATPVSDEAGRTLLDPRVTAWGEHFRVIDHVMTTQPGDSNADYTFETYDLADARKTTCRRTRAESLSRAVQTLNEGAKLEGQLLEMASVSSDEKRDTLIVAANALREQQRSARSAVQRYCAVPADAEECPCSAPNKLPPWIERQLRA